MKPDAHCAQVLRLVLSALPYLPEAQPAQAVKSLVLVVPSTQAAQTVAPAPEVNVPAAHVRQPLMEGDPTTMTAPYEPAAQYVHAD